jgi:molybdopterin molybdotransferase
MISVADAQALIRAHAPPLPVEPGRLSNAHGRILREPITCPEDFPPFDRSAMDGYAVRTDDPSATWEIVGEIRAGGHGDLELQPGQAIRIFTGARLPGPGLRVIMQEDVAVESSTLRPVRPSSASHVRLRGEDAKKGEILLQPGQRLDAAALALLASMGQTTFSISRPPRILHVTTGDEIIPPDQPLQPGQIRNSNSVLISNLCREWGAGEVTHLHAPDHLSTLIDLVQKADPKSHDVLLVSGGSGGGDYDFTGELFRTLDTKIHFQQVDVRPGKPLIFGTAGSQLVFGLPGNALSHFVCFHLFVRPALTQLIAAASEVLGTALIGQELTDTRNSRETWWPVRTHFREGRLEVRALPWKSSGDITRLPGTDALIQVPGGTDLLSVAAAVRYLSTRSASSL